MLPANAVIFGSLLNLVGSALYIVAMFRGQARPNRISWFMWSVAPLIAFAAELSKGVGLVSIMTLMVGLSPLLVLIASFFIRQAYWKITTFDWWCGGLSVAALILWALTREGDIAIFFSIAADALAAVPTLRKAISDPTSEHAGPFAMAAISGLIATLTITTWTFAHYGFPVYMIIINALLAAVIMWPRAAARRAV